MKPLILISNDDGIEAPGIRALAARLASLGEMIVVAPDRERSAQSHALSLDRPLRAREREPGWWAVDGTPADCAYLALMHLCPRKPDLLVSGINRGYNLGSDFFYSGTVAAAVEGAIRGVPSFAISMERGPAEGLGPASARTATRSRSGPICAARSISGSAAPRSTSTTPTTPTAPR